jgi:trans-aconitate methyltransferase
MKLINTLKQKRWEAGTFQLFYKVLWSFYNVYRFIAIPSYRSRILHSIWFRKHYHQFSNFTKIDCYPSLFQMAKQEFDTFEHPKILSFGCSTGEEVATLSKYIPHASIVGVDINTWCLKEANRKYASENRKFLHSHSPEFLSLKDFDAIFCLAVFQHSENRHNKDCKESAYPFEQFESQLKQLDDKLKSKGLLFIDHCDFNFLETNLMLNYQIAKFDKNQKIRQRPIFNRKNQKIAEYQNLFRVYQKK